MQTTTAPEVWESPLIPNITISVVLVTPEIAGEWLLMMDKQRKESLERSDRYALDMADSGWPFTGDPMRFDTNGAFIDGQHRAKAIVKSSVPQPMLVIRGLHPDTMRVLDIGFKRTFTNLLQMAEIPNASYVASITKADFLWSQGLYGERGVARVSKPERLGIDATHAELWTHFGQNPQLIEAGRAAVRMAHLCRSKTVTRTSIGLAWILLGRIDPYKRDEFLGQVAGSVELTDQLPGYVPMLLGDRLTRRVTSSGWQATPPQWQGLGLLIRSWNGWVRGERPTALRLPTSPSHTTLPMPIDPNKWEPDADNDGDNAGGQA